MSEIKLNFYDEVIAIKLKKDYEAFKADIANTYKIDTSDVTELIIYYFTEDKVKLFIRGAEDYKAMSVLAKANKNNPITLFLEIHEESRLFKQQNNVGGPMVSENLSPSAEKIRQEILEKERLLKETLEKETQRRKEEAKKKSEEENKRNRLEELRRKKKKLEEEEEKRKKEEKNELMSEVTRLMNDNMESLKMNLINNTVNQSMMMVDKQMEKRLQMSQCKDVHSGYTCSSCSVTPIVGMRYSCGVNTDFHLCENCEYLIGDAHPYPLLKYRNTKQGGMKIKFVIENTSSNSNSNKNIKNNNSNNSNNAFNNNFNKPDDIIIFEDLAKNK